ncbi:MAG TPA: hypothetical protein VGP47_08350 [Parachlamydiaceae bacterium]|nr:hypothetical protein [Parachlamydiaceae bacterium]
MNIHDNNRTTPASAFDIAKGYVTKGNEIGKEILANIRDTKMNAKWSGRVAAPYSGDGLSIGKKALNFFHLGLVAAPALGGMALTAAVIKMLDKREHNNNLEAKDKLQGQIKVLYKEKLVMEIFKNTKKAHFLDPKIASIDKKLNKLDMKLDEVNEKLKVQFVDRDKESLIEKRNVISNFLDENSKFEISQYFHADIIGSPVDKEQLFNIRKDITGEFLKKVEDGVNGYENELQKRVNAGKTFEDRLSEAKTKLEEALVNLTNAKTPEEKKLAEVNKTNAERELSMAKLTDTDINNLIDELEIANEDASNLQTADLTDPDRRIIRNIQEKIKGKEELKTNKEELKNNLQNDMKKDKSSKDKDIELKNLELDRIDKTINSLKNDLKIAKEKLNPNKTGFYEINLNSEDSEEDI